MYVGLCVGHITDFGTVSATSALDMPCNGCVLQSDQSVECAALCRNSLYLVDICNDAHWGWQITEPCQGQRHVPCVSMLVKLKFLLMHAQNSVCSNDVCLNL